MAARRRYTAKERAKAVGIASLTNATAAAETTGIPESTLRYWMDAPQFAELRSKTRDGVADEFWSTIQLGVKRLADLIPQSEDLREVATAVGILYDKHALLTGMATARSESRDLTGTMQDADVIAAVRAADAVAVGGGTAPPGEDAPEG